MRHFFLITFLTLAAAPAFGQIAPDGLIGVFGDWSAFATRENGKPVCYVGGEPQKAVGKYKKRGDTFILVTRRSGRKSPGVFSLKAGYSYKPGSGVEIAIGPFERRLFTDGGRAWAYNDKADRALVGAMKGGSTLIARGVSSRGTATTDTYSLKGFTAAYAAASKACGIK